MNLFGPKTLDKILSTITKVISDLEDHAQHHHDESHRKQTAAYELNSQAEEHDTAAAQAKKIKDNLSKLLA